MPLERAARRKINERFMHAHGRTHARARAHKRSFLPENKAWSVREGMTPEKNFQLISQQTLFYVHDGKDFC